MEINELNRDERVALLGLLKLMIQADREMSAEEGQELNRIAAQMGPEVWKETKKEAMEQLRSADDIRQQAGRVTRQPARELIYDLVFDMALPGAVVDEEKKELDWLVQLWELKGR